jgi:hypothetical protein
LTPQVKEIKRLDNGLWQVIAEGKYDDVHITHHKAVVLADIMTVRKG